jgi:hypothetical protein
MECLNGSPKFEYFIAHFWNGESPLLLPPSAEPSACGCVLTPSRRCCLHKGIGPYNRVGKTLARKDSGKIQGLSSGIEKGVRDASRYASDVRSLHREAAIADDVLHASPENNVCLFGFVCVKRWPTVGMCLCENEGKRVKSVVLPINEVAGFARNVVEARHLLELERVVRAIESDRRGSFVTLSGKCIRAHVDVSLIPLLHAAQENECREHAWNRTRYAHDQTPWSICAAALNYEYRTVVPRSRPDTFVRYRAVGKQVTNTSGPAEAVSTRGFVLFLQRPRAYASGDCGNACRRPKAAVPVIIQARHE